MARDDAPDVRLATRIVVTHCSVRLQPDTGASQRAPM